MYLTASVHHFRVRGFELDARPVCACKRDLPIDLGKVVLLQRIRLRERRPVDLDPEAIDAADREGVRIRRF